MLINNGLNMAGEAVERLIVTGVIVVVAIVAKIASKIFVKIVLNKIEDDDPEHDTTLEQRAKTLASLVNNFFTFLIFGITLVTILSQWGVDIAPILTGAGIIGLAIGFGAQTLVKDIVTGFFILLENQFNVGDQVEIAKVKGKVKSLRLRTTVLRGDDGIIYTIPNSQIGPVAKFKKPTKKS